MRFLVKIGSNILTRAEGGLDTTRIAALARDIAEVRARGDDVLLVSSGAVAAGMKKMCLEKYPRDIRIKQAAAAAGQSALMRAYEKYFEKHGQKAAQLLLTRDDFKDRSRYLNARNTLNTLLEHGFIPVVNENDPISVAEIKFGDNDHLAALVAGMLGVDKMIILSDVDGLYDRPPAEQGAQLIPVVKRIDSELFALAGGSTSGVGTGGMFSKLKAARMATSHGISVSIVNGRRKGVLREAVSGLQCGTTFEPPQDSRLSSRKGWIAYGVRCKGVLHLDEGAARAILKKSLLPSGIAAVDGDFGEGDAVECRDPRGRLVAKGLVNYSAQDISRIMGRKTSEIEALLGYKYSDEVIHRDNLVLVEG